MRKSVVSPLWRWFLGRRGRGDPERPPNRPILIIVEGPHDSEFLKHMSVIWERAEPSLPNLADWEAAGRCVFIPAGGGDAANWTLRLSALRLPQFHLFDRETPEVGSRRADHIRLLNLLPHCCARLTAKRSLENYLHPQAIRDALCVEVELDDETAVADVVARLSHRAAAGAPAWDELPARSRKRRRDRVKHRLHSLAAPRMTIDQLIDRDPAGEVCSWLETIQRLATSA